MRVRISEKGKAAVRILQEPTLDNIQAYESVALEPAVAIVRQLVDAFGHRYAGGIRDDALWHAAECPGVPAFQCGCADRRAALTAARSWLEAQ